MEVPIWNRAFTFLATKTFPSHDQRISFFSQSHATHAARSPNFFAKETICMPQPTHAQTQTIQISVINESTVLADSDVVPVVAALQKQVTNDFGPVWGTAAQLTIVPKGNQPPSGS